MNNNEMIEVKKNIAGLLLIRWSWVRFPPPSRHRPLGIGAFLLYIQSLRARGFVVEIPAFNLTRID